MYKNFLLTFLFLFFFQEVEAIKENTREPDPLCKLWFDGCNNCFRNEEKGGLICTKRACSVNKESKCLEYFKKEVKEKEVERPSNLGYGPTGPPEENFIEPTTPPPVEEKKSFLSRMISWFKSWFN